MSAGTITYMLKMNGNWLLLLKVKSLGSNADFSDTYYRVEDVIYSINRSMELDKKINSMYEVQDWPIDTDINIIKKQIIDLIFTIM
jgi:hypothetical protein